jgi:putative flippase GtrA
MSALRRLVAILLASRFVRFSMVGTVSMVVDMGILQAVVMGGLLDPRLGRVPAFLGAATVGWALNRSFTFRQADRSGPVRQWLRYVSANSLGLAANLAVYYSLIGLFPLVYAYPFLGVAGGSVMGLAFNFTASKRLVFAAPRKPEG